jgi:tRNA U34 5-methylaminomethyl-2-thiouridine-forming methyltransferase MnmC
MTLEPETSQNPFETELIETSDGSHTLKLKGVDEQYHSVKGALQESQHVFLQAGFLALKSDIQPVRILEVGFGTGLNALITARQVIISGRKVFYDALEPYPVSPEIIKMLNYPGFFSESWMSNVFENIHSAGCKEYQEIRDGFLIRKFWHKIQDVSLAENHYDLVYFDAFGPDTQPEMWTENVFKIISNSMRQGGILVTYCSKGSVRRAMQAAWLEVEKLPGPPGKREISRAHKKHNQS